MKATPRSDLDIRVKLDKLDQDVRHAVRLAEPGQMPEVEADEDVIKFFNPEGTGKVQYFVYQGCMIIPTGKLDEVHALNAKTSEDYLFGQSKFEAAPLTSIRGLDAK